jgi:hypothetical protein
MKRGREDLTKNFNIPPDKYPRRGEAQISRERLRNELENPDTPLEVKRSIEFVRGRQKWRATDPNQKDPFSPFSADANEHQRSRAYARSNYSTGSSTDLSGCHAGSAYGCRTGSGSDLGAGGRSDCRHGEWIPKPLRTNSRESPRQQTAPEWRLRDGFDCFSWLQMQLRMK